MLCIFYRTLTLCNFQNTFLHPCFVVAFQHFFYVKNGIKCYKTIFSTFSSSSHHVSAVLFLIGNSWCFLRFLNGILQHIHISYSVIAVIKMYCTQICRCHPYFIRFSPFFGWFLSIRLSFEVSSGDQVYYSWCCSVTLIARSQFQF